MMNNLRNFLIIKKEFLKKLIFFLIIIFVSIKLILSNSLIIAKLIVDNKKINEILVEKIFIPNAPRFLERLKSTEEYELIIKYKKFKNEK